MIPILAREVRIIGGPTGPALGATGLTGPTAGLIAGATGWNGHTGHPGHTGLKGAAGDFSKFIGATGSPALLGSGGFLGPLGPIGEQGLVNSNNIFVGQNVSGWTGFSTFANALGCKFTYSVKNSLSGTQIFMFFSGLFIDTIGTPAAIFQIGISMGTGPSPNAADFGGYGNNNPNGYQQFLQLRGNQNNQIPFFLCAMFPLFSINDYAPNTFPEVWWFDLVGYYTNGAFGGTLKNVTGIVFEIPGSNI